MWMNQDVPRAAGKKRKPWERAGCGCEEMARQNLEKKLTKEKY
jgi:hypothetical protein